MLQLARAKFLKQENQAWICLQIVYTLIERVRVDSECGYHSRQEIHWQVSFRVPHCYLTTCVIIRSGGKCPPHHVAWIPLTALSFVESVFITRFRGLSFYNLHPTTANLKCRHPPHVTIRQSSRCRKPYHFGGLAWNPFHDCGRHREVTPLDKSRSISRL